MIADAFKIRYDKSKVQVGTMKKRHVSIRLRKEFRLIGNLLKEK